jgi:pilus assembly protein CpaF
VTVTAGAPVDRALADRIRTDVLDRLRRHPDRDRLALADTRQLVRGWIEDQLGIEARRRLHAGLPTLPRGDELAVLLAVENLIWGLGRLQALLDRPDVEDVHITGTARPVMRLRDGSLEYAEPVADSDDDLIRQLQHIAAHHGTSERAFSPAQPCLNMQLPDGSRLAAMRDVVPHPTVTIRRHRLVDVTLHDLERTGTLSKGIAGFLRALVRSGLSVVVTGRPTSGKTTLLRAMAREIPPDERVATMETEFELDLHRLPHVSPLLVAMECRAGSTEIDPATGRRAGEITLSDLLHQTLRMSVTRVIVGEVRGAEALPMLEAMNAGMPGSLCTLHAGSAGEAFERLVTAAMKGAGRDFSDDLVTRLAAQGIDYVVHLRHLHTRFVAEIAEVTDVNERGVVAMNRIFGPGDRDPRGHFRMAPQRRAPFDEAGISLDFLFSPQVDRWTS